MFEAILEKAGGLLTSIFGVIANAFSGVTSIFYTPGTGDTPGSLTIIGQALAFTLGAALVGVAVYVIFRLVRSVTNRVTGGVRAVK